MINSKPLNKKFCKYLLGASVCSLATTFSIFGQYIPNPDQKQAEERRRERQDIERNRVALESGAAKQNRRDDECF